MKSQFSNELAIHLAGKISDDDLRVVMRELSMLCTEYDIESRQTSIVTKEDMALKCFQSFMIAKKIEGLSEGTLVCYKIYISDFIEHADKPLAELNANDIRAYLYSLQKRRNISNRTLDSRRLVVNGFLEWCNNEGYINRNPCCQIGHIKFEEKPREPLDGIEMELVRCACKDNRDRAIVETFYSTGCRVSELVTLDRFDIDFANGEVQLFGKGRKYRTSYINAKAEVYLKKYLTEREDTNPALFVTKKKPHGRLSKAGVEYVVREIGKRSTVGRPVYPHLIRHTTATDALSRGMNVAEVQKILGHTKLDTTMIYAKVLQDSVKYSHKKYVV